MAFSVLMSVYGGDNAEHLRRALDSVTIEQTLKPDQLVLVTDGQVGEDIAEVIRELKDRLGETELTTVELAENRGLAVALNAGLEKCKYELVARMDADDVSVPERFLLQTEYMQEHEDVSVLGGVIREFEDDESVTLDKRVAPTEHEAIVERMKTRNAVNHMTVMFRKSDVLDVGGYSEDIGKLEDYKLWIDLILAGKRFCNLDATLVNVRVGGGFIERRSAKREVHDWDALQAYMLRSGFITKAKARKNKLYIRLFIYSPKWLKKIAYKTLLRTKA